MLRQLNEIRALKDPIKQSQVEFIICDTPGLLLAKLEQAVLGKISGNEVCATSKELRLRCTSYSYPGTKIGQTELILGGHRRRLGTIQNKSGIWKVKVTEDFEGSVLNIIQAWCDLIHANVAGFRLPSILYSTLASIELGGHVINPRTGKKLGKRTIWLKNVYPIAYQVNDLNPTSSDPIDIDISFNYDYFADNSYSLVPSLDNTISSGANTLAKGLDKVLDWVPNLNKV